MKMGSKRGAAAGGVVLEAPEDDSTWGAESPRRRSSRSQRRASGYSDPEEDRPDDYSDVYDEPAFKRQGGASKGGFRLRVRKGLPKSWIGRGLFLLGFLAVVGAILAGLAGLRSALLHDSRFVMTTSSDVQIVSNHNV